MAATAAPSTSPKTAAQFDAERRQLQRTRTGLEQKLYTAAQREDRERMRAIMRR